LAPLTVNKSRGAGKKSLPKLVNLAALGAKDAKDAKDAKHGSAQRVGGGRACSRKQE
jgi:hypothetical protein